MFKSSNFCHSASNNRNNVKAGLFIYRTTDNLETVTASGYFNPVIIDIKLHDLIVHEQIDAADQTKVKRNLLCVIEKTLENVRTKVIASDWEEEIEEYIEATFVKKDGSSIMSAPLKFISGSMRGAVGPYLNGVGFWKLDSQGNLTQIATLSDSKFIPTSGDTMDLGNATHKLKTIYAGNLNNGYDIAIPETNSADTLGLKSQIDDAANSGEQLYTTGVWYAKMYAATVVPTGAEYDGRNYADFSQTNQAGKPIIVVYEGQGGAWVELETITPPANHNGYMTITSKIWDIVEQAGQQGGLVLWAHNQETFTPYPRIVSFDGANITNSTITGSTFQGSATLSGQSTVAMPNNPVGSQIANVDYVTDHADPLKYATNCITEIPQDIKLELNNGTLTLKAGSKVYVPNGSGVFDTLTIANDLTTTSTSNEQNLVFFFNGGLGSIPAKQCFSGSPAPSGYQYMFWYDTTNNLVKFTSDSGSTWTSNSNSLPLGLITANTTQITSIDQVFNGFGYIDSTVFVLPGVKVLIPDGKNSDGTLKNIIYTTNVVKASSVVASSNSVSTLVLRQNADIWPTTCWYDSETNYIFNSSGTKQECCIIGHIIVQEGRPLITSFYTKKVFIALDRNDREYIAHQAMPSNKYINLSLAPTGSSYIAPADGWFCLNKTASDSQFACMQTQYGLQQSAYGTNGMQLQVSIPVTKGDTVYVYYDAGGTTNVFRFIYANGAV